MRQVLDRFYSLTAVLSGLCIVAICLVILARVVGRWFGVEVPSSDDFAGFLLVAGSFFGLAYTFRQGGHIRVSLVISKLSTRWQKRADIFVLVLASLLTLYLSWYLFFITYESYLFEEVSSGYVPVPLWLVQFPMGFGMLSLAIAIIDQTVGCLFFDQTIASSEEQELVEQSVINMQPHANTSGDAL
ncbi:TRAP transporter small permease [Reinekea thalattae]|uniref:TRAP transporter small permease protein n=1 Tax=Reinekea thalattae TaxID=2593301 RepID=A0A5C8ZAB9_9GAMM|nr:TRAP transporter small permease [Reinekea thalattae]TXR53826.1 TRAP transporter small permease [Reinekea thalattae]